MKLIKQGGHSTLLNGTSDRTYPLRQGGECGNCNYKDLIIGFTDRYDWESNTCSRLVCPKCSSRLIYEYEVKQ